MEISPGAARILARLTNGESAVYRERLLKDAIAYANVEYDRINTFRAAHGIPLDDSRVLFGYHVKECRYMQS